MTGRRCDQCQYFNTKAADQFHDQCHAPIPIWVVAEFTGSSGAVVGAVDANWSAEKCELFRSSAAPAAAGAPSEVSPASASAATKPTRGPA